MKQFDLTAGDRNYIINLIKDSVRSTEPNATVILYGSVARGDYTPDSDIDILILIDQDKISRADRIRITYPLYDIEIDTGVVISTMLLSKVNWYARQKYSPFYDNVVEEGLLL